MKFNRMPPAEIRSGDATNMREAITMLLNAGYEPKRPSDGQLKLDSDTSFYPSKGTLHIDRQPHGRAGSGLELLKEWMKENPAPLGKFLSRSAVSDDTNSDTFCIAELCRSIGENSG